MKVLNNAADWKDTGINITARDKELVLRYEVLGFVHPNSQRNRAFRKRGGIVSTAIALFSDCLNTPKIVAEK